MKHKHNWQLVKIYHKLGEELVFPERRYASFICECGCMKEVKVKVVEE